MDSISNINISPKELEFAVFVVENVAESLGVPGDVAYRALTDQSDILRSYVIPSYDVLHTQGKTYIVDDVIRVMHDKGVAA